MYNSGARLSKTKEASDIAIKLYKKICNTRGDCYWVSKWTNFSIEQCNAVKNYAFRDSHNLSYGYEPFLPDYAMAMSWLRLSSSDVNKILKHDSLLVYHEFTELMYLLNNPKMKIEQAHELARQKYDYDIAVKVYEATFNI